jgi:hypothetical protein
MALECVPAKQIRRFRENCGKMDFICKKSPVLIGKPSINGPFSLAMFNNQRLCMYIYIYILKNLIPLCKYAFTSLNVRSVPHLKIRIIQVVHCMSHTCSQNRAKTGDSSRKQRLGRSSMGQRCGSHAPN